MPNFTKGSARFGKHSLSLLLAITCDCLPARALTDCSLCRQGAHAARITSMSQLQVNKQIALTISCMRPVRASTMSEALRSSFGCLELDDVLGGFPVGLITDIAGKTSMACRCCLCISAIAHQIDFCHAGESTAGKTQLCLQLLLACQWPLEWGGLAGSSL